MKVEGNKVTCDCGFVNVVAGLYRRKLGTRKVEEVGRIPADGQHSWGRIVCIGCGKQMSVPGDSSSFGCG
jgi:hypothetical protein